MNRPTPWPDWLDSIWAKSPEKPGEANGETLAEHTWRVLAKLGELVRLRPGIPAHLGFPRLWHCLFWSCWLHDFGKAAQGFQATVRGGNRWPYRHELLSLAFLDWIESALSEEEHLWVAAAIASHHRDTNEIRRAYSSLWLSDENQLAVSLAEVSEEAIDGLWRWLDECAEPWTQALGFHSVGVEVPLLPDRSDSVEGLRRVGADRARHWVKSYVRFVDRYNRSTSEALTLAGLVLRGYVTSSDYMASAHTGDLPRDPFPTVARLIGRLGLQEDNLYDHQRQCTTARGSAVLVAPTGSGKTEAALIWAMAQSDAEGPAARLFYVLPYQASMNAMYDRLTERAFPGHVGLEHSRSTLALYRRFVESSGDPRKAANQARWNRSLARLHYFPVRVLSPYQILKAPYRLHGYENLLTDFYNAVVIIDEVHAYEPDRLAIILATVKYLRERFKARFFVMSATLPSLIEGRLAEALGDYAIIRATPDLFAQFRRHMVVLRPGDLLSAQGLSQVEASARSGESVLVCCNTVRRAQTAYCELRTRLEDVAIPAVLLHGRFNARDRLTKEGTIRNATGSKSTSRYPIVVVATQVVEVSLDVDLDVAYTDPAPLEALIQRFGRINRRRRRELAPVYVFREPVDGQGVYDDQLVRGALAVMEKRNHQTIEEDQISDWLDEAYQGPGSDAWNAVYERTHREFCEGVLSSLRAFNSDDGLEEMFYRAFDSIQVLPAGLQDAYRALVEIDPLQASELLVPVRWGQYVRLRSEGRVRDRADSLPSIVEADYDAEYGLHL